MQEVKLKNGGVEMDILTQGVLLALKNLITDNSVAFYDLVMKCRDDQYEPFGNSSAILKHVSLMESGGTIHSSIKNIVLSAVDGDEGEMHIVDPIDRG